MKYGILQILCGYGGIGRRAGFRFQFERVQVQLLLSAPKLLNIRKIWMFSNFFITKIIKIF